MERIQEKTGQISDQMVVDIGYTTKPNILEVSSRSISRFDKSLYGSVVGKHHQQYSSLDRIKMEVSMAINEGNAEKTGKGGFIFEIKRGYGDLSAKNKEEKKELKRQPPKAYAIRGFSGVSTPSWG